MNELVRKKISYKMRGRKLTATHRKHISQTMTKIKKSDEHKKAISEAMRIIWLKRKKDNEQRN